jgi:hypothetical protein
VPHSSPCWTTLANVQSCERCISLTVHVDAQAGDGHQTLLPPSVHSHHWGLGFKQSSLHHVGRVERHLLYSVLEQ